MRVFSATTPCRTTRSRTASSSGATRRLWGWLGPSSSRRGMSVVFWGEAVVTAVYILNRSSTKALNGRTPYKAWHGCKSAVSHLWVFDCLAFVKELGHIGKLDDRSTLGVFIGYAEGSKAYHILDPGTQRVRTTHNIVFDEGQGWGWDKAVDDDSTPSYDNFIVEYVHFKGVGGVGSSLPLSMSTSVPEPPPTSAPRSPATTLAATGFAPPPPPQPATSCTPASTATLTPARVEHNLVEFATLLSHDESASTRTTTASCCGIIRWRTFSTTSRCRDWSLTIWRRSCILRATTVSLGLSQRPRDTRHGVLRCSRR
jgi:hypothetical protein